MTKVTDHDFGGLHDRIPRLSSEVTSVTHTFLVCSRRSKKNVPIPGPRGREEHRKDARIWRNGRPSADPRPRPEPRGRRGRHATLIHVSPACGILARCAPACRGAGTGRLNETSAHGRRTDRRFPGVPMSGYRLAQDLRRKGCFSGDGAAGQSLSLPLGSLTELLSVAHPTDPPLFPPPTVYHGSIIAHAAISNDIPRRPSRALRGPQPSQCEQVVFLNTIDAYWSGARKRRSSPPLRPLGATNPQLPPPFFVLEVPVYPPGSSLKPAITNPGAHTRKRKRRFGEGGEAIYLRRNRDPPKFSGIFLKLDFVPKSASYFLFFWRNTSQNGS